MKPLVIGCDNAAVELKHIIVEYLIEQSIPFEDVGVNSSDDETMYPNIADRVIEKITESGFSKEGILLCGTGIGMALTANKYFGIYAAVCHDTFSAERARLSNDANVITMGARVIGSELAKKILKEWLSHEFKDGPSTLKIEKIKEIEKKNFLIR